MCVCILILYWLVTNNGEGFDQYNDVFDGLTGCIIVVLYHINISPSCQPTIPPSHCRPI